MLYAIKKKPTRIIIVHIWFVCDVPVAVTGTFTITATP